MKKLLLLTPIVLSLCGCSLIPKKVEFFQDKVHKFPQPTAKQEELQREAAALAKQKTQETVDEALKENASPYVLSPAREAEKLADAVSTSLGPPVSPSTDSGKAAARLNSAVGKHDQKVAAFAEDNDKNAGKKIEGTGLLQIPYFVWVGGVVLFVVVGWHLAKLVIEGLQAYPPTAVPATVAIGGLHVAEDVAGKALKQVVAGGQAFKTWITNEIKDADLKDKVLGAFTANHQTAQDEDVQTLVKGIK
jgi:hypothetical protein